MPVWQDQVLACDSTGKSLSDLRFFVSNVSFIDTSGNAHAVELRADDRWQQADIAFLDLEDSTGSCRNGTTATNTSILGAVSGHDFVALRFTVGVPFELNHANPLLAAAPLNDSAMHWHWRSGYKFLRAGVTTEADGSWLHLGSTGCKGTVRNITGCSSPNRFDVELLDFQSTSGTIVLDLAELFQGTDLQDSVRTDCSSGPAESACVEMFAALENGNVFRVRP